MFLVTLPSFSMMSGTEVTVQPAGVCGKKGTGGAEGCECYEEDLSPLPGCCLTLIWKRNHCRNMEDTLRERDIIRSLLRGIFGGVWCWVKQGGLV